MRKIIGVLFLTAAFAVNVFAQETGLQEGLALKYLVHLPTEKTAHPPVIILLHGYGSDEKDLLGLCSFFPKNYLIISARAPYPLPGGGYEWYEMTEVKGLHDGDAAQLANSMDLVKKFIPQIIAKYKTDPKLVYLMGFSQGAIMSYRVGLTAPTMLRGIGVLSGTIYPSLKPMIKMTPALKQLRIFIAHGNADNRISFEDGSRAFDYLTSIGLTPDFHSYEGMGHTISKEVMADLVKWLK